MHSAAGPEWVIREDADVTVLVALCLRQMIGVRAPDELPHLRGVAPRANDRSGEAQQTLERQWTAYWEMTVEPTAHPSAVALELVDGFETLVALPVTGFTELRSAIIPHAAEALAAAQSMHARYVKTAVGGSGATSYRAYASAIAEHERQVGRRAHSFELNVQVLPFSAGAMAGLADPFSSFSFDSEPMVEAVTLENLRGTSVLEAPEDLAAYANTHDHLRSAALAPDASARLIRSALRSSKEDAS